MSETPGLIETSFFDAITIIAAADELPEQTRRHWTTSLRQIAKALDKPLEVIPAGLSAVRGDLARLHHAPTGLTPKTLQNHKSNVRSALPLAGAGQGHSGARRTAHAGLGGTAVPNQESIRALAAVVFHAVLLRERDCAG